MCRFLGTLQAYRKTHDRGINKADFWSKSFPIVLQKKIRFKNSFLRLPLLQVSNIAATGIFDPFTMEYAGWIFSLFNIPGEFTSQ